jgi:hypothetical protein
MVKPIPAGALFGGMDSLLLACAAPAIEMPLSRTEDFLGLLVPRIGPLSLGLGMVMNGKIVGEFGGLLGLS